MEDLAHILLGNELLHLFDCDTNAGTLCGCIKLVCGRIAEFLVESRQLLHFLYT